MQYINILILLLTVLLLYETLLVPLQVHFKIKNLNFIFTEVAGIIYIIITGFSLIGLLEISLLSYLIMRYSKKIFNI